MRRCGLRQDGDRHTRGVQGGAGRQAGRIPCANDNSCTAALQYFPAAHEGFSGARRNDVALSDSRGDQEDNRGIKKGACGHRDRHAQAVVGGCHLQRSGPSCD